MMEIRDPIKAYNDKRYTSPWAANVTLNDRSLEYTFDGLYLGTTNGGTLTIDASPGDVIAIGQRDLRRPDKSTNDLFIVLDTGELDYCSRDEAVYHLKSR